MMWNEKSFQFVTRQGDTFNRAGAHQGPERRRRGSRWMGSRLPADRDRRIGVHIVLERGSQPVGS